MTLWMDLVSRKTKHGGEVWCILSDFNFVYSSSKKVEGDNFDRWIINAVCVEFNNFIS